MTIDLTQTCSFKSGCIYNDTVVVSVMNDKLAEADVQHSVPLRLRGETWDSILGDKVLPFLSAGICETGDGAFMLVGWGGQALRISPEGTTRSGIVRKGLPYAPIRACRFVGGHPTAVGAFRHVYRYTNNIWMPIDNGVASDRLDPLIGFEAVGGYAANDLYAAGLGGELWHMDNESWNPIEVPTNVDLQCIECTPNEVYVGGKSGILLRGSRNSWSLVEIGLSGTLWQMAYFKERLFIFSEDVTAIFDGTSLEIIKDKILKDSDFHTVTYNKEKLWCFGSKNVVTFDGRNWNSISANLSDEIDIDVETFFDNRVLREGSIYLPNL